jgi:membrane protein
MSSVVPLALAAPVAKGSLARLRRHDLLLCAAGVTFYAAISAVPGMFVALRIAAALTSRPHVVHLGADLASALPQALGAPGVVRSVVGHATGLGWWQVAIALLPASLYGEGLRRALVTLGDADDRLTGWRGRVAVLPVLAVAPGLLLALLAVTPRLAHLFGAGGWAGVLGVVIAFTTDWLLASGPLVWVFRVVPAGAPGWRPALVGGVLTASFVAGFLQGFVLFLSLPLDLGAPFGGLTAVGGACALLLWLWLLHIVVLCGYVVTVTAAQTGPGHGTARGLDPSDEEPAALDEARRTHGLR